MTKAILVLVGLALIAGTAFAQQPAPDNQPTPVPVVPKPVPKPDEKVGGNESLQHGDAERPWAAGVSREKQAAALKLFHAGNKELNLGLFENAIKQYRAALKSWEHPAIHYNLALALLKLDQPLEVYDSLQKAIKFGPAPLEKEKFEHAQEYLSLVSQQIASVEVTCKKPGAKISVDGKEVFTVGPKGEGGFYKGRVRIGKHTFVAEKPGFNAEVEAPFIGPGEIYRIELRLYTAEELTRHKRRWEQAWLPYAVIGGGAAFGLIGLGLGVSAGSSYDEFDAEVARCNMTSMGAGCEQSQVIELRDSGDTKKTMSYIGYGIAAGAVAVGVTMIYLNRSLAYQITADDYRKEVRAKERESGHQVNITPIVAPDIAGAMIHGSF